MSSAKLATLAVGIAVMLLTGQHDAAARLREITIPGEGSVTYGQYQGGVPQQIVLPGGVVKTMAYDPLSGMVSNRVVDASGNAAMDRIYQRNRTGGITGMNTEHGDYAYAYDAIDQLTDVGDPVLPDQSFSYDPAGNRRSSGSFPKPGTGDPELKTYAVNNLNQYLSVTSESSVVQSSYDLNGNVTQEVVDGVSQVFRWDMENRLVGYSNSETGVSASYYYDPFGRRLRKVVNGVTNWYVYADEGLVEEMDGEGNEVRSYGYAPNSLWMNDPLYMRVPGIGATNIYYFLNDHLGAPQKLVARNGEVVWSMDSEAFGKAVVPPDSTITNNLGFSSQLYDGESGMHYNTHRYYDPAAGRYLSRDKVSEVGSVRLYDEYYYMPVVIQPTGDRAATEGGAQIQGDAENQYLFAANSPQLNTDPYGLVTCVQFGWPISSPSRKCTSLGLRLRWILGFAEFNGIQLPKPSWVVTRPQVGMTLAPIGTCICHCDQVLEETTQCDWTWEWARMNVCCDAWSCGFRCWTQTSTYKMNLGRTRSTATRTVDSKDLVFGWGFSQNATLCGMTCKSQCQGLSGSSGSGPVITSP